MADDHVSRLYGERLELWIRAAGALRCGGEGLPTEQFKVGGQLQ